MFSKKFLKDASERALATFAQTALALLLTAGAVGLDGVNWLAVASVSGFAGVISLLKSVVAAQFNDPDSASLVELNK